jgi:valyl-tRNA synthetase
MALAPVYDPQPVEEKWYRYWEERGYFGPPAEARGTAYCIVMPPPNVTGELHMGHALNNTLQDVLIRWRRMQGYDVLWLPGTDHAGIATQARVEEQLAREGLTRHDLGREAFLERTWAWKERYGHRITTQLRRLGASCDWGRERFTMDPGCSAAVVEVFVRLYEEGLIYRDFYIVNWCPRCHTVISDIEVEHEEVPGQLYYIRYPLRDGEGGIVVATTRPETMLGDTAVAVHPRDPRYRDLVGRTVILPLVEREIPVIADDYVDPDFGTGAVKITPAHDPADFEVARRHGLPRVQVIGPDAAMSEEAGRYRGLDRWECRKEVVRDLRARGLLVRVEDYSHAVGHCYRCHTVIEPMVSRQWFVRMKPLAEPAIRAAHEGRVRFVPERFTKIYLDWLENIRDWCISRQLWWGHRIPVWYCVRCGSPHAARSPVTVCGSCGHRELEQDPDVLDTWFSSALWPFSTLGWPEATADLRRFYPTTVLVTGRDIIFFWVARMIFMGLKFMDDVPFHEVFVHGLVLDALGRKMSKSLGNGVDPMEVVESHGADALRFMLVTGNTPGYDLRFHFERLEGARNFANKLWNAARFVLMNLEGYRPDGACGTGELADRWILSRLAETVARTTAGLEAYELGEAARAVYDFVWDEFCDWYIELAKPRLYGSDAERRATAQHVLVTVLRTAAELLHPFMPHITEEIWQQLPGRGETIMRASWPAARPEWRDPDAEGRMALVMDLTKAIRSLRAAMNVPRGARARALVVVPREERRVELAEVTEYVAVLANTVPEVMAPPFRAEQAAHAVVRDMEIFLPLAGLIDLARERARLEKELAHVRRELDRVRAKLDSEAFVNKAPTEVVAKERAREAELVAQEAALKKHLAAVGAGEGEP